MVTLEMSSNCLLVDILSLLNPYVSYVVIISAHLLQQMLYKSEVAVSHLWGPFHDDMMSQALPGPLTS